MYTCDKERYEWQPTQVSWAVNIIRVHPGHCLLSAPKVSVDLSKKRNYKVGQEEGLIFVFLQGGKINVAKFT